MDDREQALTQIADLAARHGIGLDDIAQALGVAPMATDGTAPAPPTPSAPPASRGRHVLVRVLGVLGGTFIFAGIGVFIALQWDAMNPASRVVATLGVGVAAFMLAGLARRDVRFGRAATPLWLVAAVLEPVGMLVAFDEFGSGGDWRWASLATAAAMTGQFALAFVVARRSTLLFVGLSFAVMGVWTALDLADLDGNAIAMTVGASLLCAAVWADRAGHADITPLWFFVGGVACLAGLFDAVESTPWEASFLVAAAGCVYVSVLLKTRTLLVVATLAILAYTGWFTSEHFADSLGWPLALVVFGVLMMVLSAVAVRIDRQFVRR